MNSIGLDENAISWLMSNAGMPNRIVPRDYIVEVLTAGKGYNGSTMSGVRLSDVIHSVIATSKPKATAVGRILISIKNGNSSDNYKLLDGMRINE